MAMGLTANLPRIEASQSLVFARAIGIAFGDSKALAAAIYEATGNGRLAQRVEIDGMRGKNA
jgi:hypothetical protein